MRRKIDETLDRWADAPAGKPLLIRGARRVGKTYAVKALAERKFPGRSLYCDFQKRLDALAGSFSGETDVSRIVSNLEMTYRFDIDSDTLLIFDEVQLCEKALNALRFFDGSGYRVIATGSQLGVLLGAPGEGDAFGRRTLPFPSDVKHAFLNPLDFEEFLWALGEERLAKGVRASFNDAAPFLLHEEALSLYRSYVVTGGMPRPVAELAAGAGYDAVQEAQDEICQIYVADIALHAPEGSAVHVNAVWRSLPSQLARETTRKFKYADVARGGRESRYREPLAWLEAASLVNLNYQTNDCAAPLSARDDGAFFKAYLADTGLLYYRSNLDPDMLLVEARRSMLSSRFRGALAENYVMQALRANGLETYYWCPGTTSQAEVEFVLQARSGHVVPVEVKSGDNVRSRSLGIYREKCKAPFAIRISAKNFGWTNGVMSVPLYAAFCIDGTAILERALEAAPGLQDDSSPAGPSR